MFINIRLGTRRAAIDCANRSRTVAPVNYFNLPTDNSDFIGEETEQDILCSLHEEPMFDFGDVIMPRPFTEFVKAEVEEGHAGAADDNDDVSVGVGVPPVDAHTEPLADIQMGFIMGMGNNSVEAEVPAEPSDLVSTGQITARRITLPAVPDAEVTSSALPSYNQLQVQSSLSSGIRRSSFPMPDPIPSSSSSSSQIQGPRNSSINVSYLFDGLQYTVRQDIT